LEQTNHNVDPETETAAMVTTEFLYIAEENLKSTLGEDAGAKHRDLAELGAQEGHEGREEEDGEREGRENGALDMGTSIQRFKPLG
jgi:hypothetical protein